jgi:hypothetical protein
MIWRDIACIARSGSKNELIIVFDANRMNIFVFQISGVSPVGIILFTGRKQDYKNENYNE